MEATDSDEQSALPLYRINYECKKLKYRPMLHLLKVNNVIGLTLCLNRFSTRLIWCQDIWSADRLTVPSTFCAIGFFNEADTLESSSILIYSQLQTGLCTPIGWREAAVIKKVIKRAS